jgi:hypothetical protein
LQYFCGVIKEIPHCHPTTIKTAIFGPNQPYFFTREWYPYPTQNNNNNKCLLLWLLDLLLHFSKNMSFMLY